MTTSTTTPTLMLAHNTSSWTPSFTIWACYNILRFFHLLFPPRSKSHTPSHLPIPLSLLYTSNPSEHSCVHTHRESATVHFTKHNKPLSHLHNHSQTALKKKKKTKRRTGIPGKERENGKAQTLPSSIEMWIKRGGLLYPSTLFFILQGSMMRWWIVSDREKGCGVERSGISGKISLRAGYARIRIDRG